MGYIPPCFHTKTTMAMAMDGTLWETLWARSNHRQILPKSRWKASDGHGQLSKAHETISG